MVVYIYMCVHMGPHMLSTQGYEIKSLALKLSPGLSNQAPGFQIKPRVLKWSPRFSNEAPGSQIKRRALKFRPGLSN